jgi:DNA adenine methylase
VRGGWRVGDLADRARRARVRGTAAAAARGLTPPLKYVGSKRHLVPELLARIPATFGRYVEPFCGSAALYFALQPARAVLGDVNADLITTYRAVVDDLDEVIAQLRRHQRLHSADYFYRMRERWNRRRLSWSPAKRASAFIYFNKTAFNGLWRVNAKGEMNVPMGRYANPTICNPELLRSAAAALRRAELRADDYRTTLADVQRGDLVYIDSPHDIRSKTASFTSYTARAFTQDDQAALADVARQLAAKGAHVILSNADTPLIRTLYRGFRIERVAVPRLINSVADRRGAVAEVIITVRT